MLSRPTATRFFENLKNVCQEIHGEEEGQTEYDKRVSRDPAFKKDAETLTIDLANANSPEVKMALFKTLGLQTLSLPEEIDEELYAALMKLKPDTQARADYIGTLNHRMSSEAVKATIARLDEAIAHAEDLERKGKVIKDADWSNPDTLNNMANPKDVVQIKKSNNDMLMVSSVESESVKDLTERDCPSYFKRDFFDKMFPKNS